jgi:hypothetical protein
MYLVAFCFLGLAALVTAATAVLSLRKPARAGDDGGLPTASSHPNLFVAPAMRTAATGGATWQERPIWHRNATWSEIKSAWLAWYARCQEKAIPRQTAILSWGRTFALCAVLCLAGAWLGVEWDQPAAIRHAWSNFRRSQPMSLFRVPQVRPFQGKLMQAIGR